MNKKVAVTEMGKEWSAVRCKYCKTNMGAYWSMHANKRYCSDACKQKAYRMRLTTKPLQ